MRQFRPLLLLVALLATLPLVTAGAAAADPAPVAPCALPSDRAAAVDALLHRCSWEQTVQNYRQAKPGALPTGTKDGWVLHNSDNLVDVPGLASALWRGKTLFTGTNGGYLINRTVAGDMIRADVHPATSLVDDKPMWALDYSQSPAPWLYDEIREVSPGVWLGYSWWRREAGQKTLLLAFLLA